MHCNRALGPIFISHGPCRYFTPHGTAPEEVQVCPSMTSFAPRSPLCEKRRAGEHHHHSFHFTVGNKTEKGTDSPQS